MILRVELDSLPGDVRRSIEAGEAVEVSNRGFVVARVEPQPEGTAGWDGFIEARRNDPPLDYDGFLADLARIRATFNQPLDEARWA